MKRTSDSAREMTDRELAMVSRQISLLFKKDKRLLLAQKRYSDFMKKVKEDTQELYEQSKSDEEAKKAYVAEVKKRTLENREYRRLIDDVTKEIARVNQLAVDLMNSKSAKIYTENYNQVAEDCRKVGIKVGREEKERKTK